MSESELVWPSWSVDLPGLNERNAHRLLAWVETEGIALGGSAVDPARAFTLHVDDMTVEMLMDALHAAMGSGALSPQLHSVATSFESDLAEWSSERGKQQILPEGSDS